MELVNIGIGFLLLIAGRPAYWVFTGSMAFLIGQLVAGRFPMFASEWNSLVLGLLSAIFGVMLAFLFHRWAARLAGFAAGGFLAYAMPIAIGAQSNWTNPVYLALAGLAALVFLLISFDFGLVVISALTAVTFILRSARIGNLDQGAMFLILVILSLITQYLVLQYARPSPD